MSRRTVWAVRTLFLSAVLLVIAVPDANAQCAVLNATPNPLTVNTPVSLTWSAPTAACTTPDQPTFTGYRVYVQVPGGGSFQQIGDTAPAVRNFQYTPTLTGSYQFRVTAVYTNAVCGACIITEGNSNTVTVNSQACTYVLEPQSIDIGAGGGSGSFIVMTNSGCSWVAVSASPFIAVTSGASGSGSGTVSYSVQSNTGSRREGAIVVDIAAFRIRQAAAEARPARRRSVRH